MSIVQDLGTVLSLVGGDTLTASYARGTPIALQGTDLLEYALAVTAKTGTSVASGEFQVHVSDDLSSWTAVAVTNEATGTEGANLSVTASDGATVRARLTTKRHASAKYAALAAKTTGASATGDAITATLKVSEGRLAL